jgi:hypothetical protein
MWIIRIALNRPYTFIDETVGPFLPSVRVFMSRFFLCSEPKPCICRAAEAQVWETLGESVRSTVPVTSLEACSSRWRERETRLI